MLSGNAPGRDAPAVREQTIDFRAAQLGKVPSARVQNAVSSIDLRRQKVLGKLPLNSDDADRRPMPMPTRRYVEVNHALPTIHSRDGPE